MEIKKVGIVGAGQMGAGIAEVCACAGLPVYVLDISPERLAQARDHIEDHLARQVERGRFSDAEAKAATERISFGLDYAGFSDCQLVIEAAVEDESVKKEILKRLCESACARSDYYL